MSETKNKSGEKKEMRDLTPQKDAKGGGKGHHGRSHDNNRPNQL